MINGTDDTQGSLVSEAPAGRKEPKPVQLRSSHDYTLTTQALESRVEGLKKLAKKNEEEGYQREARAVKADADAIEHHVLPMFRAQVELPLVTRDQLRKEVEAALRRAIFAAFEGLGDPKVQLTPDGINFRRTTLLNKLTEQVTQYAQDLADGSFVQGLAAREHTAEALALRSVQSLYGVG